MIISNMVLGGGSWVTDQAPDLQQAGGWYRLNEEFRTRYNSRVRKASIIWGNHTLIDNPSGYSTNQVFRFKSNKREHCLARLETISKF